MLKKRMSGKTSNWIDGMEGGHIEISVFNNWLSLYVESRDALGCGLIGVDYSQALQLRAVLEGFISNYEKRIKP